MCELLGVDIPVSFYVYMNVLYECFGCVHVCVCVCVCVCVSEC